MGKRGPQPSPNARRRCPSLRISLDHLRLLDGVRGNASRNDALEMAVDLLAKHKDTSETLALDDLDALIQRQLIEIDPLLTPPDTHGEQSDD